LRKNKVLDDTEYCGLTDEEFTNIEKMNWKKLKHLAADRKEFMRDKCCPSEPADSFGDCDSFDWPKGPAMNEMLKLGGSNEYFYMKYLKAWKSATENGFTLTPLQ